MCVTRLIGSDVYNRDDYNVLNTEASANTLSFGRRLTTSLNHTSLDFKEVGGENSTEPNGRASILKLHLRPLAVLFTRKAVLVYAYLDAELEKGEMKVSPHQLSPRHSKCHLIHIKCERRMDRLSQLVKQYAQP